MYHLVSVRLEIVCAVVFLLRRAAEHTPALLPAVFDVFKANVAVYVVEVHHLVIPIRRLGAIEAAAGQMGRQLRDGDAVELVLENVIGPLLQIRIDRLQPFEQTFGNLTEKYAALTAGVQKRSVRVAEQLLRQQVEHGVRHLRRGKHLVV